MKAPHVKLWRASPGTMKREAAQQLLTTRNQEKAAERFSAGSLSFLFFPPLL